MELFKLIGTIAIDNTEAKKKLNETGEEGKKTEGKLSKLASGAATVGKGIATGLAAGAGAVATIGGFAIKAYAEYEQLAGGAKLLFGDAYGYIEEQSKNAYQTVQMSTNDYLQQVNGFSTGLKTALGGNEQAAAELAHKIVVAEADIVAATGNSAENVQNAFNGIMKSNFTMLDNLQLGITPTKEGFQQVIDKVNEWNAANGEATKYQIDNLADCQSALIDYIEMQGLSGYATKEASGTIQGSLAMVKASWENLLTGLSDPSQDLGALINNVFSSVTTLAGNLIPRITEVLKGIATAIQTLIPMLAAEIPNLFNQLLPPLIEGATALIEGLVSALPGVFSAIIAAAPMLIDAVVQVFDSLVGSLPQIIDMLVSALPTLIPALIDGVVSMVMSLVEQLPTIIQALIDALPTVIITFVEALTANLPVLIDGAIQLIMGLVTALPQIIQALIDALPTIISTIVDALLTNLPAIITGLIQVVLGIVEAIPQIFNALFIQLPQALAEGIFGGLGSAFGKLGDWFGEKFSAAKDSAVNAWSNAKEKFSEVKEKVTNAFSDFGDKVKNKFSDAKEKAQNAWSDAKTKFSNIKDKVVEGFSNLGSKIKTKFSEAKENAQNTWANTKATWQSIRDKVSDGFTGLGNKLKTKFKEALETAKQGFSNATSIGKNLVEGIWNGITNAKDWLLNKIKGFAKSITQGIKNFFGIKSPSRVMRDEVGKMLTEGVAVGITENTEKAESAATKMGKNILKAAQNNSLALADVELRSKVTNTPAILESPTIFGYSSKTGSLLGGGGTTSKITGSTNTGNSSLENVLLKILKAILTLDANMADHLREALEDMGLELNNREFARLVKAVN